MKMKHFVAGLFAVTLMALVTGDAFAQRGGGAGRPGGAGGFGGRPGGFGGGPGGGGDPGMMLLMSDKVRADIGIEEDQVAALRKIGQDVGGRPERPDFDFRNASEEDRAKFFEEMQAQREERSKKMREQLEEVLLPDQLDRLEEISLQFRGLGALADPEIEAKLAITEEQKEKMKQVRDRNQEEMRGKMRELMQSRDREQMAEAFAKVREETESEIMGVLTSDQKSKFDKMKGKPFEAIAELRGVGMMGRAGGPDAGRGGPDAGRGGRGGPDAGRGGPDAGRGGPDAGRGGRGGPDGGRGGPDDGRGRGQDGGGERRGRGN